ncbi:hypothetical protein [Nocardioides sp.]|uniref:hypothetical protein n=1 Tax=Nocardioides sp. TaxID=35761 RepID=UPI003517127D
MGARLRRPGPPLGRPLPTRVGSLASSVQRFASSVGMPVDVRVAMRGPGLSHGTRPPRWWVPAAPTEIEPATGAVIGRSVAPAARWLAGSGTVSGLPERGLPRAARGVPDEDSYSPGGIVGGLRPETVRVRRHPEVTATGPMLTSGDQRRLSASTVRRRVRAEAAAATAAVPAPTPRDTRTPGRPATPGPSDASAPRPAGPAGPSGPSGPAAVAPGGADPVRRTPAGAPAVTAAADTAVPVVPAPAPVADTASTPTSTPAAVGAAAPAWRVGATPERLRSALQRGAAPGTLGGAAPPRAAAVLRRRAGGSGLATAHAAGSVIAAASVGLMQRAPGLPSSPAPTVRRASAVSTSGQPIPLADVARVLRADAAPGPVAAPVPPVSPAPPAAAASSEPAAVARRAVPSTADQFVPAATPAASGATAAPVSPAASEPAAPAAAPVRRLASVLGRSVPTTVPASPAVGASPASPAPGPPVPTAGAASPVPGPAGATPVPVTSVGVGMPDQFVLRRTARHGRRPGVAMPTAFGADGPITPASATRAVSPPVVPVTATSADPGRSAPVRRSPTARTATGPARVAGSTVGRAATARTVAVPAAPVPAVAPRPAATASDPTPSAPGPTAAASASSASSDSSPLAATATSADPAAVPVRRTPSASAARLPVLGDVTTTIATTGSARAGARPGGPVRWLRRQPAARAGTTQSGQALTDGAPAEFASLTGPVAAPGATSRTPGPVGPGDAPLRRTPRGPARGAPAGPGRAGAAPAGGRGVRPPVPGVARGAGPAVPRVGDGLSAAATGDGPASTWLLRSLRVAPPRVAVTPREPAVPAVAQDLAGGAGPLGGLAGSVADAMLRRTPAGGTAGTTGAGGSLLDRSAALFDAAGPGAPATTDPFSPIRRFRTSEAPMSPSTPLSQSSPPLGPPPRATDRGGSFGLPPEQAARSGGGGSDLSRADVDRIVDAVVERIEHRVVEELERRGRRHDWKVF